MVGLEMERSHLNLLEALRNLSPSHIVNLRGRTIARLGVRVIWADVVTNLLRMMTLLDNTCIERDLCVTNIFGDFMVKTR